jgi:hypothetical protein
MSFNPHEDELLSDKEYMECTIYHGYGFRQHPLETYKGPESLNIQSRNIITARYQKSLSHKAFPSNIMVNKQDSQNKQFHRRLERERCEDSKPWETPVPRMQQGKSNQTIPLNDGGKVSESV